MYPCTEIRYIIHECYNDIKEGVLYATSLSNPYKTLTESASLHSSHKYLF